MPKCIKSHSKPIQTSKEKTKQKYSHAFQARCVRLHLVHAYMQIQTNVSSRKRVSDIDQKFRDPKTREKVGTKKYYKKPYST